MDDPESVAQLHTGGASNPEMPRLRLARLERSESSVAVSRRGRPGHRTHYGEPAVVQAHPGAVRADSLQGSVDESHQVGVVLVHRDAIRLRRRAGQSPGGDLAVPPASEALPGPTISRLGSWIAMPARTASSVVTASTWACWMLTRQSSRLGTATIVAAGWTRCTVGSDVVPADRQGPLCRIPWSPVGVDGPGNRPSRRRPARHARR
jgi:hypothetical protein